jgi:hypothetical protein
MSAWDVTPELGLSLSRWQKRALIAGGILYVASVIGGLFSPNQFFRSYLFAYLFWIGLALGSMAIVMLQYLTGGIWGVVTRRIFEAASRTLPLLAILFIPILIGIPRLYNWAHPQIVQADDVLRHRSSYMNPTGFILRAICYFAVWLILAYFLNKWSREEDESNESGKRRMLLSRLSPPGLILYVFTVTFSSIDWAESLADHWFSTMWGFLFVASQGLIAMSFGIIILAILSRRKPLSSVITSAHFHALGKLLLMFVMLWAYFQFSQLLIVWSGNLTHEIPWYMPRFATTWRALSIVLIYGQFMIPFLLLLSRPLKQHALSLSIVAAILLGMRFVDLFWIVMPEFYRGLRVHWLDFTVPMAFGGLWLGTFLWQLKKRPLLPLGDPSLEEAVTQYEGR